MNPVVENIIEISWVASRLINEGVISNDDDQMPDFLLKETIIDLAEEYERLHPGASDTYFEDIEKFATIKLTKLFGKSF